MGVFVLGWAVSALATAAGEIVLRQTSPSARMFDWVAYAPLTDNRPPYAHDMTIGYGVLLGWLVGLILLVVYLRTRSTEG